MPEERCAVCGNIGGDVEILYHGKHYVAHGECVLGRAEVLTDILCWNEAEVGCEGLPFLEEDFSPA